MNRRKHISSTFPTSLQVLLATIVAVAVAASGCHCGGETGVAPGEQCDEEGERDGDLICVNGEWVVEGSDVGFDVGDNDCTPETHEEFCQRHDVECGSFQGEDNCGWERSVHCEDFDGYGCEDPETCAYGDDHDDLDTNVCRCPELGDDPADDICDYAGAECGTVDASEICGSWDGIGEIDCGGCDGDDECGEEIDNICGCPCEIDGECYSSGESAPGEECLICDPDESDQQFTEAEDGTACQEAGVCEDGECICEDDDALCDGECVDLDSSRDHCGECDHACADDEVCDDGACVDTCPDDDALCDGQCVDTDSDIDHCGECNNPCSSDDDDVTASCDDGQCVYQCADDAHTFCDGDCTDTTSDPDHCGACGEECSTDIDGATAECIDGDCVTSCDDDGDELCEDEGLCTDTSQDRDHCGECGNACQGGNEFCNNGVCETFDGSCNDDDDCATGEQCCGDVCIPAAAPC